MLGYVVLDRSKCDSNLLTVNWSDPKNIHKCFVTNMGLTGQNRVAVVGKGSIPVAGACQSNASGLVDRFWLPDTLEAGNMDRCAKVMEEFSNDVDDADRMPKHPTGTSHRSRKRK